MLNQSIHLSAIHVFYSDENVTFNKINAINDKPTDQNRIILLLLYYYHKLL